MSKRGKILTISVCTGTGLLLLLVAAVHIALSSAVICSCWLPMAGRKLNAAISASEVKVSLLRNTLELKDFFFASQNGIEFRIESLQTEIAFFQLFSKDIRINSLVLHGGYVKMKHLPPGKGKASPAVPQNLPAASPVPPASASAPPAAANARIPLMKNFQIPESLLGWKTLPFKLALRDLSVRDFTVEYSAPDGMEMQCAVSSLTLNRISPGMTSELRVDSLLSGTLKTPQCKIHTLPICLSGRILLDYHLFPEAIDLSADFHQAEQQAVLMLPVFPDQPLSPREMRLLLRGRRNAEKWELEHGIFAIGKSSLKASGTLEPRANSASAVWTLKLYPGQLPKPLPDIIRKSGVEVSSLEGNGKLSFFNGRIDYSDILSAAGLKLDENNTAVGDIRCAMNYIVSADLPAGTFGLSSAMLDLSEGQTKLITLQSKTPLKFYRTREGILPDPGMSPNLQFHMRETALPKLNMFLKGRKFRKGAAELSVTAAADAQRKIRLEAALILREKRKGNLAAQAALSALLDPAGQTRPDTLRIASDALNLPLLREIFTLEEVSPAASSHGQLVHTQAQQTSGTTAQPPGAPQKTTGQQTAAQKSPAGQQTALPERTMPADRMPLFLRDRNVRLTLDLRKVHCADDVNLALTGDIALRKQILEGKNLLLKINGTAFPMRFEANLQNEHFKVEGTTGKLNAGPLINLCLKQKNAAMMVDSLQFDISAEGFTPERIRRSLTGSFVGGGSGISVPLELDQSSDLFKLVMIPLENIPALLGMIGGSELKNLALEKTQALTSVLNGTASLQFSACNLDAAFRNGVMTLKDLTLTGDLIPTENLRGTVNLANGEMNLKTRTGFDIITIPLNFSGTVTSPAPDYAGAITDFLKVNAGAPLQKTVDTLLNKALNAAEDGAETLEEDNSTLDKAIDKGIQKGLRGLEKWLNGRKNQK